MGRALKVEEDALVYIQLGDDGLVQLEGGRAVRLPDIPFPVRRVDLEAYHGTQELPLEVLVEGALAALASERDPEQVECYRRFLFSVEPHVDQLLVAQGLTLAREDKVEAARARFEALVSLCPDHAPGWLNLGLCNLDLARRWPHQKSRFEADALAAFRRAVEIDDRLASAYFYLGCLHRDRGETDRARAAWRRCVGLAPRDDDVARSARDLLAKFEERQDLDFQFEDGCLAVFEGRLDEAGRLLSRVAASRPQSWEAAFFLGLTHRLQGDYDRAVASFSAVVADRPDESEGWAELGLCELERGHLDAAEAALEQAERLQPDHPRVLCNLGLVALRRGETARARARFHAALAADPQDPVARGYLELAETRDG